MSSANRVEIRYVSEVTWGTTPATPTLAVLRMTGESLNANIENKVSEEIRSDRNPAELIQVGSNAGGAVNVEFSPTSYNDLLEGALASTWVVDGVDTDKYTLVNGSTDKSFTLQRKLVDITQYFNYVGSRVNTMAMQVGPNKIVTGSFGFISKSGSLTASQFAGATLSASGTTLPFNGAAGVTLNQIDAGAITGGLMDFKLNVSNNYRAQDAVGSVSAQAIVAGKFEASGDIETYFEDGTLYDKFAAGTAFAFQIKMESATHELWVDIPNAKFTTAEVVAQGSDTDVMIKAGYTALYHAGTAGCLKLTRNGPL